MISVPSASTMAVPPGVLNARRHRDGDRPPPPFVDIIKATRCSTPEGIETVISLAPDG